MNEAKAYYDEMLKLREQNDQLREVLKDIREYAELRSASMPLLHIEEIVETVDIALQEDSE